MEKINAKTKEELIDSFTDFFDRIISFLKQTDLENLSQIVDVWYAKVSKEYILQVMDNHISHHRGQMDMYLMIFKQKTTSYRGW